LFVHTTSVQDKKGNKTYNNNILDREIILIHRNAYYFFCRLIIAHSYSAVLDSSVILLTPENYNCKI